MNGYLSILSSVETEIEIKKSIFISRLIPIKNEEEASLILSEIKKEHYKANHHCYAYILGANKNTAKFSDDGEPGATAGRPIFGVLERMNLTDVLCVVIRYFGGVKLGASGLTRAYASAASEVCDRAKIFNIKNFGVYSVKTDYSDFGRIKTFIDKKEYKIKDIIYGADVVVSFLMESFDERSVIENISEMSAARAVPVKISEELVAVEYKGECKGD